MRPETVMNQGFPKSHRLLKRQEFLRVYSEGTPYRNAGFHLFIRLRAHPGPARIGLTASRPAGGAVARNRLKRWAREDFRRLSAQLPPDLDLVLNFHPSLAKKSRQEFDQLFENILGRAKLLATSRTLLE